MLTADVVDALRLLNLVSGGALVGLVLAEAIVILPLVRSLTPADGVAALRFTGARGWRVAPACGATSWGCGLLIAALWPWEGVSASAALTLAADACMAVAVGVTFLPYIAVDKRIQALSPAAASMEAPVLFRRMAGLHALRTSFYGLAFVCFAVAAVV